MADRPATEPQATREMTPDELLAAFEQVAHYPRMAIERERAAQGAAPRKHLLYDCGGKGHGSDVSEVQWCHDCTPTCCSEGAAPRAEGLPVERLARAIKSRYGLKESESEVSIFLNAIFGSGEAGHD